jgi:predicted oxidoreductase
MSSLLKAAKAVIDAKYFPQQRAAINALQAAVERAEKQEDVWFEEWISRNSGRFVSPPEVWTAAQQAERERIRDIIKAVGVQGEHDKWFDACDAIMEKIDATE